MPELHEGIHLLGIIGIHTTLHKTRNPVDHQALISFRLLEIRPAYFSIICAVE